MAFMDEDTSERLLAGPLERLCTYTITEPEPLREELQHIREQGWASSLEETNVGVWGLAVPILGPQRDVTCAVGIAGPIARLAQERVGDLISRIHQGAQRIAEALGGSVPEARIPEGVTARRSKTSRRRG
jgi:DNA-binding IclR family transcriptional regulator